MADPSETRGPAGPAPGSGRGSDRVVPVAPAFVRGAHLDVVRTVARLRSTARRRGRRLVATSTSPTVGGRMARLVLALGANPARTVGLLQSPRTRPTPRGLLVQAYAGVRGRLPAGGALVVSDVAIGRELDVSLRLRGPAERLEQVTGLALADAGDPVEIETLRSQHHDTLWLVATLPTARFERSPRSMRLMVRTAEGTVPVRLRTRVDPSRARPGGSLAGPSLAGTFRVRAGRGGELVVSGSRSHTHRLPHAVRIADDVLIATWDDPGTAATLARLTHRGTGQVVTTEGTREPDGRHRVEVEVARLSEPVNEWAIEVLSTGHGRVPLSRPVSRS